MDGAEWVAVAAIAFVGTHFLLSHPLRQPLVARLGEAGFIGLYSVIAALTLGWLAFAYRAAPASAPLWDVGNGLWAVATLVMLVAAILLMGSLVKNPALPNPGGAPVVGEARGVYAVTRHPMMWAFALWAACHILVYPLAANIVLSLAVLVLALVGAALQDRKKQRLQPDTWRAWEAKTSYLPFAALARGRARISGFGLHALAGGVVVWLAATWAHIPLAGWAAGIWRWVG
ncbi:NnrU family protein [Lichenihabitans psoromatis]|uniref:NnrU family protein n=1 Tax=Lichenihabitans psoromatis TaxID=2528642 RepID=UPI0010362181|nr:NnrU family protein [Lichenihabitans psoromatis]